MKQGGSYVFAGKEALDCGLLLQKLLTNRFGIERLMVAGGGVMNWSFLSEGLLDEISLVVAPVADGSNTAVSIFEQAPFLPGHSPVGLTLQQSKVLEGKTGIDSLQLSIKKTKKGAGNSCISSPFPLYW